MSDRPIIFSAPMITALLDGRKTQTRRILKPQPIAYENRYCARLTFFDRKGREIGDASPDGNCLAADFTPYAIGDRLWVRETIEFEDDLDVRRHWYSADNEPLRWSCREEAAWLCRYPRMKAPSIHMPRWASRLTLAVTEVRVERLQEISEADAIAEGCPDVGCLNCGESSSPPPCGCADPSPSHRDAFAGLWHQINGPDSWHENPWIAALTFEVHRANIDAMPALEKGFA